MLNILSNGFNKGVPTICDIKISKSTLVDVCSDDKESTNNVIYSKLRDILEEFKSVTGYGLDLVDDIILEFAINKKTLENRMLVGSSYDMLGKVISHYLNTSINTTFDVDDWKKTVANRTRILKNIANEVGLKNYFPYLYNMYINLRLAKTRLKELENLEQNTKFNKVSLQDMANFINNKQECLNIINHYSYFNDALSVKSFNKKIIRMFDDMFKDNYFEILENIIKKHPISYEEMNGLNKDKFELFFVYTHLAVASQNSCDKQKYIYYVAQYFKENKDRLNEDIFVNLTVTLANGKKVAGDFTISDAYEVYKKIVLENPDIHAIAMDRTKFEGMNLNEVEEYINNYINGLQVSWEILNTKDSSMDIDIINKLNNSFINLSEEEKQERINRLQNLYFDKKEFFDSLEPFGRILGKNMFSGYIGYIFLNGKVVLEKFFDNYKTGKITENQAIYIMDADSFIDLTLMPKNKIIKGKYCDRVYHKEGWQNKVRDILEVDSNEETIENVKKLVKLTTNK